MAPKGKKRVQAKPEQPENTPPNWPPLTPLLNPMDISFRTKTKDQILLIPQYFTSTLCKTFVSFLSTLPLQTTPGNPQRGMALRINDRFEVNDPAFARVLWEQTCLRELIQRDKEDGEVGWSESERRKVWGGEVVGLNPRIRIYRYTKGQHFAPHYDESNLLTLPSQATGGEAIPVRTTWTLLVYLTSSINGCIGGETVFYPEDDSLKGRSEPSAEPIVVELETGMALLHKHGPRPGGVDCMLHEGREVQEGEKWILRSDICVRR
jgi:2OG-Fe(II) oxygenase superfamily